MVIDTSALVAILTGEPEQAAFIRAIEQAATRLLSTATWVETSIVIGSRYGPAGLHQLDRLLTVAQVMIVPVDVEQARFAREAYQRYGKGRHPAGLNFGDCFSYALATCRRQALLFKGTDLSRTNVSGAEWNAP